MNPDDLTKSFETETYNNILQQQIKDLKKQVNKLNTTLSCKNKELLDTKKGLQNQNFGIDRFRHNTTHFKF